MLKPRKILFSILTVIFIYCFFEVFSSAAFIIIKKKPFYFKDSFLKREKICDETLNISGPDNRPISFEIIHPYLGFTGNPDNNHKISNFGFFGDQSNLFNSSPDQINIAVFGGSVACQLIDSEKTFLIDSLKKLKGFVGKKIVIYNLALGGYKQPQQLMTLNYFLALGAHFDVVINIDGFNEVALPPYENLPKGTSPIFPRNWYLMVSDLRNIWDNNEIIKLKMANYQIIMKRKELAALMMKPFFKYIISLNLFWEIVDQKISYKIFGINKKLISLKIENEKEAQKTGPKYVYTKDSVLYKDLALIWARCSIQMNHICQANGIKYFHFLQPNQYLPGSKPMSEEEQKIALSHIQPYRIGAEKGYPFLLKESGQLKKMGVHFWDLTRIFSNNKEIIYADNACHFNRKGNDIVAGVMFEKIKPYLNNVERQSRQTKKTTLLSDNLKKSPQETDAPDY